MLQNHLRMPVIHGIYHIQRGMSHPQTTNHFES